MKTKASTRRGTPKFWIIVAIFLFVSVELLIIANIDGQITLEFGIFSELGLLYAMQLCFIAVLFFLIKKLTSATITDFKESLNVIYLVLIALPPLFDLSPEASKIYSASVSVFVTLIAICAIDWGYFKESWYNFKNKIINH